MKQLLLVSAIAALSITGVHAAPTVYGKAFLSVDTQKNQGVELNSNGSRIGFKGSEALDADTDVIYKLEYGVSIDTNSPQFTSRDTYLGLANKQLGTVVAGRITGVDDYVNYANVTKGSLIGVADVFAGVNAARQNNALAYFSPSHGGIQVMGMYAINEGATNLTKAFGVAAKYEPQDLPLKVGASYVQDGTDKAVRVSGAYALGSALTVGALYQNTGFGSGQNKENAFAVSGKYNLDGTGLAVYGQLDSASNVKGVKDVQKQRVAVGTEYKFNKNTIGHLYGAVLQEKTANVSTSSYGVGAGLEYLF